MPAVQHCTCERLSGTAHDVSKDTRGARVFKQISALVRTGPLRARDVLVVVRRQFSVDLASGGKVESQPLRPHGWFGGKQAYLCGNARRAGIL